MIRQKSIPSVAPHGVAIALIIIVACGLRLILFSGFVLGDDPAYADYVSRILAGHYPPVGDRAVFACRPLLLYAIALPVRLFGWYDWSFVMPILAASLLNTVLSYWAGFRLAGLQAGIISAIVYATFPLDVVHATTMTNDILLSSFVWGGGLLLFIAYHEHRHTRRLFMAALSGLATGAAIAVKVNAVVAAGIFPVIVFMALRGRWRRGGAQIIGVWAGGWLAANILLCLFLYLRSGDALAHYHAEMNFNLGFNPSGYVSGPGSLARFLLYYPKLMLGIIREGHQGYRFMPYGYFFVYFLLCLPLLFFAPFRKLRLPAGCALVYLLVMQFAPLQLSPHYLPIHRLPRFLHIASMPAAVALGLTFSVLLARKARVVRAGAALALLFLIASSVHWAWVKARFYRDCARDQRWAWEVVCSAAAERIFTDIEMRNYLMFRSGFRPRATIAFPNRLPRHVPERSMIIAGGARRPDMAPRYAADWAQDRQDNSWLLVSEAPFAIRPWRPKKLHIWLSVAQQPQRFAPDRTGMADTQKNHAAHRLACNNLIRIAEVDVGDPASEAALHYTVHQATWSGSRHFPYADGNPCRDDGRAHRGSEALTLRGVHPGRPLLIIKRMDPTVVGQVVDVDANGIFAGTWRLNQGGLPGHWQESTFTIAARHITSPQLDLVFRFKKSTVDINSFYYWFYQPLKHPDDNKNR